MYRNIIFILLCPGLLIYTSSCNKDEVIRDPPPCTTTYINDIKPIADNKCSLPGCHNAGSSLGDYTTYEGIKAKADNGRLEQMVFELKIMPPANATQLTEQEKVTIKCWLDNGAPEN